MRASLILLSFVIAACVPEREGRPAVEASAVAASTEVPREREGEQASSAGAPSRGGDRGSFAESSRDGGRGSSADAPPGDEGQGLVFRLFQAWAARPREGFRKLDVPGFLPAVLSTPDNGRAAPLIVAGHGAGGVPESECEYWRRLSSGRALILCLRGERTNNAAPSGYYYRTHLALGREFRAAVAVLRARFATAPDAIYTGFSQGAIMGAPMIVEHARDFPYLVLIEGGFEYWSPATARSFARGGGKRVLFACGTRWCAEGAESPAAWLRQSGVEVRIEHAPGAGHTAGGAVAALTRASLPWLTAGATSWSGVWGASAR